LVKSSGVWNPSFTASTAAISDYYSVLSVGLLPNVYSIVLNADIVWVFKLIIPFIVAFVPVGLYQLWKTQLKFSDKSAFLSVFFFISFQQFFTSMLTRQQVAELFLVLALLLLLSGHVRGWKGTALLIVLMASLAVSHYAIAFIFVFYLVILLIGSALIGRKNRQAQGASVISTTLVALAIIVTFGWYMYVSGGASYTALLRVGALAANSFYTELFAVGTEPVVASVLVISSPSETIAHGIEHYWILATLVLITIGLVHMTWRRKAARIDIQFLMLSLASYFLMLLAVAVPLIAGALGGSRLYALSLFFLAPYCVFGIEAIVGALGSRIRVRKDRIVKLKYVAVLAVLVPYFLFMSGFIFEITEHPSNYAFLPSLGQGDRVLESSLCQTASWSYVVPEPIPAQNVHAVKWISSYMARSRVYADDMAGPEVRGYGNIPPASQAALGPTTIAHPLKNAYVYFGAANVQTGTIEMRVSRFEDKRVSSSFPALTAANRVYGNGLAEVYYIS
jgi:uncharacterized membrane protein